MESAVNRTYRASIEFTRDPSLIKCHCDDCDWKGTADTLQPIGTAILTPGHPSPAGRCPACDSLAYTVPAFAVMQKVGTEWVNAIVVNGVPEEFVSPGDARRAMAKHLNKLYADNQNYDAASFAVMPL